MERKTRLELATTCLEGREFTINLHGQIRPGVQSQSHASPVDCVAFINLSRRVIPRCVNTTDVPRIGLLLSYWLLMLAYG